MNWEKWQPNMTGIHRVAYVALGPVMMAWGFWYSSTPWVKLAFPLMGACTLISGLISFCPTKAVLTAIFGRR